MLLLQHMPGGHSEGRCGRNKSSLRLDRCQDTAEPVPLCLTLKVFDLQQGDRAAGSSKNTSPRHVCLCVLCIPAHVTMRSLLSILICLRSGSKESKDPRRDLRAHRGQTAASGKPISIWGNQQDRCFRAQLGVAQVCVCMCTYKHTHHGSWILASSTVKVMFSSLVLWPHWCLVGSLCPSCLSTMAAAQR